MKTFQYEKPLIEVVELLSEGILCESDMEDLDEIYGCW
jgi:hypothetical protein